MTALRLCENSDCFAEGPVTTDNFRFSMPPGPRGWEGNLWHALGGRPLVGFPLTVLHVDCERLMKINAVSDSASNHVHAVRARRA